ncbi:MAG: hypothetical protein U0359_04975 [Byssovorax sp.]
MPRHVAALAAPLALAVLALPAAAGAVEVPNVGGKPLLLDVTNTFVFNYRFDNRNFTASDVSTQVDDNYAEWLDRLNIQATWWNLRLGLRLDGAAFAGTLDNAGISARAADKIYDPPPPGKPLTPDELAKAQNDERNKLYRELHSRFLRSFYPSKLFIGYSRPGVDITVGDFYVQLGRGLVFSVRKIDELAIDTTVRGMKVVADHDFGAFRLGGTIFAGQMNPLRVDEQSGRRLSGDGSPFFFGFPRAGDLTTYVYDDAGKPVRLVEAAQPNYLEDTVLGAHVEGGTRLFTLGANTSVLARKSHTEDLINCLQAESPSTGGAADTSSCRAQFPDFSASDPSRQHNTVLTYSGSITIPDIKKHGDLYVEVAGQSLRDGRLPLPGADGSVGDKARDLSGYAVYASGSVSAGPLSVSLELKHYRSLFPLSANVDTVTPGFRGPEFGILTYNSPPTAEPIYTQPLGSPNMCITGGRGRADYRFNKETSVYAWLGRYSSWSEYDPSNYDCATTEDKETRTWDAAAGVDIGFERGQSHARAWIGGRVTDRVAPASPDPHEVFTFYREGYIRYDLVKHIAGPFTLQMQGFHRRRYEPRSSIILSGADIGPSDLPWMEGENYTALQWSPHLSAVVGYEYMVQNGCQPEVPATLSKPAQAGRDVCHFVNGGIQWRSHQGDEGGLVARTLGRLFDTVAVFVGQRRGAIRCVSGVCRQFPPFEGAKLELTSRF